MDVFLEPDGRQNCPQLGRLRRSRRPWRRRNAEIDVGVANPFAHRIAAEREVVAAVLPESALNPIAVLSVVGVQQRQRADAVLLLPDVVLLSV
jgi:hypothetical protein